MRKRLLRISLALALMVLSLIFYFTVHDGDLLLISFLSALSLWTGIAVIIPDRFYTVIWKNVRKTKAYWISFSLYLFFHVTLYGIFYNIVLGGFNFFLYFGYGVGAAVPPPPYLFLYWVSTSPAFFTFIGPYESDVTPYTVFIGLILAALIGANVEKIFELRRLLQERKRALSMLVAVPSLGVVSGTSCCLSLPSILIYIAAVSTGTFSSVVAILSSPIYFSLTYFGLPIASLALLVLNLRDMNKIIARLRGLSSQGKARLS
ncbi:hypothetical protein [Sulfuracidifex tepidarius]|nr:hypothetical protein [Sulfuracidifex tepidarius]